MLRDFGSRLQAVFVLGILAILLGIASPHFLTPDNILNIVQQSSVNAVLGIGLTFVIITAGIDLSVGSVLALCGLVVADLLVAGHSPGVAVAAGLAVGLGCGLINGAVTTWARIPPFITTLGMMLMARSAAKIYCGSNPISGLPESFRGLAGDLWGVPVFVLFVAAFYGIAHVALTRTKLGRYAYAIGGNEQAAWLSGVSVGRYKIAIYGLSGLMAGMAAVLMTARLNAASPLAGEMYELYAIAAAVIGGVSLMGGEGRVMGTLVGALIMGMLRNGLNLLGVPSAWEGVVVGGVLVAAVIVDRARHREKRPSSAQRQGRHILKPALVAAASVTLVVLAVAHRQATAPQETDRITIGVVPKTLGAPFWQVLKASAEKEAARQDVDLILLAPERETDVERQHQIIENLIEQDVDAILLAPVGSRELVPAVLKANEANIPLLIVDTRLDADAMAQAGATIKTFIGSDNVAGGMMSAHSLAKQISGSGQVAVLEGISGHETADARRLGFMKAIEEYPKIEVVASLTAMWDRERAYTVAQNILQAHPNIRAFFCANDEMAMGALEAVAAAQRSGEIVIVGFDANPDAVENIRQGRLHGTVAQFPSEMGRIGIAYAADLVRHGKVPPPEVMTRLELIDADTVAGFGGTQNISTYRVGLVTHNASNAYWKRLVEGAKAVANEHDVEVLWRAPQRALDVEQQFSLVGDLINERVDGILLAPAGAQTMTRAIRAANQAGIPVLLVDSAVDMELLTRIGGKVLGSVGSDNRAGGALAAHHTAKLLPSGGKVALLAGAPGVNSTAEREAGFKEALDAYPSIALTQTATGLNERGMAKMVTASWLQSEPDLGVIFAVNGLMALGAADAIAEHPGPGPATTRIIAFDATDEVLRAIDAGRVAAAVAQQPEKMGRLGMGRLVASLHGRAPGSETEAKKKQMQAQTHTQTQARAKPGTRPEAETEPKPETDPETERASRIHTELRVVTASSKRGEAP